MFDFIKSFVIGFKAARENSLAVLIFFGGALLGCISAAILEVKKDE